MPHIEEGMNKETRDHELEWPNGRAKLSHRAVGRFLGVHHEVVRRARRTGYLGDALRLKIRAYIEEHPGAGNETESQPQPPVDPQPGERGGAGGKRAGDTDRPARKRRGGRRARRRAAPDEARAGGDGSAEENERTAEEDERKSALRLMYEVVGCRDAQQFAGIAGRIRELRGVSGGNPAAVLEPCHTRSTTEATLDELKAHALSLLSGAPVVGELSLGPAAVDEGAGELPGLRRQGSGVRSRRKALCVRSARRGTARRGQHRGAHAPPLSRRPPGQAPPYRHEVQRRHSGDALS